MLSPNISPLQELRYPTTTEPLRIPLLAQLPHPLILRPSPTLVLPHHRPPRHATPPRPHLPRKRAAFATLVAAGRITPDSYRPWHRP